MVFAGFNEFVGACAHGLVEACFQFGEFSEGDGFPLVAIAPPNHGNDFTGVLRVEPDFFFVITRILGQRYGPDGFVLLDKLVAQERLNAKAQIFDVHDFVREA